MICLASKCSCILNGLMHKILRVVQPLIFYNSLSIKRHEDEQDEDRERHETNDYKVK